MMQTPIITKSAYPSPYMMAYYDTFKLFPTNVIFNITSFLGKTEATRVLPCECGIMHPPHWCRYARECPDCKSIVIGEWRFMHECDHKERDMEYYVISVLIRRNMPLQKIKDVSRLSHQISMASDWIILMTTNKLVSLNTFFRETIRPDHSWKPIHTTRTQTNNLTHMVPYDIQINMMTHTLCAILLPEKLQLPKSALKEEHVIGGQKYRGIICLVTQDEKECSIDLNNIYKSGYNLEYSQIAVITNIENGKYYYRYISKSIHTFATIYSYESEKGNNYGEMADMYARKHIFVILGYLTPTQIAMMYAPLFGYTVIESVPQIMEL